MANHAAPKREATVGIRNPYLSNATSLTEGSRLCAWEERVHLLSQGRADRRYGARNEPGSSASNSQLSRKSPFLRFCTKYSSNIGSCVFSKLPHVPA